MFKIVENLLQTKGLLYTVYRYLFYSDTGCGTILTRTGIVIMIFSAVCNKYCVDTGIYSI
jgi:hypothetical protein